MQEFEEFSASNGLPEPLFTEVIRLRAEQIRIYVKHWKKLVAILVGNGKLTPSERQTALEMRPKSDRELEGMAAQRFTWHLVMCAVDMRTVGPDPSKPHYTPAQLELVKGFFRGRCKAPLWEFLVHDVTGPHAHIGRRDFSWRQKYAAGTSTNGVTHA
jgi:hypothetical protein